MNTLNTSYENASGETINILEIYFEDFVSFSQSALVIYS